MYAQFTIPARAAFQTANQEALRLGCDYVGSEHLLLGIAAASEEMAGELLRAHGAGADPIREALAGLHASSSGVSVRRSRSGAPRLKRMVEFAIHEARRLGHADVRTEHLLLGIVREPLELAAVLLVNLRLDLKELRDIILLSLPRCPDAMHKPSPVSRYVRPQFAEMLEGLYATHSDVERLTKQMHEIRGRIEAAIVAGEFELAAQNRDEREKIRHELERLVVYRWKERRQQ